MFRKLISIIKSIRDFYLVNIKWRRYSFGNNFHAGRSVVLWAKNTINIGDNFYIGRYSQIECDAIIGDNVIFANHVALVGKYDHFYQEIGKPVRLSKSIRDWDYGWKGIDSKVVIENDVWVGYGSVILSGVQIKEGSIIGSGSVVTKDVEPYSIYAGNPARKICDRFETTEDLMKHKNQILNKNY